MAFYYSPRLITDSLYLCFDAGNTKSYLDPNATWTDLSRGPANLSGILGGTVVFDPTNGGSIVYDATTTYVRTTNQFNPSAAGFTAISYSFWLKCNLNASVHQSLLGCSYQGGLGYQWIFRLRNSNALYFQYSNGAAATNFNFSNSFFSGFNNTWMNIVITVNYSSGAIVSYRNGLLFGGGTMTTPAIPTNFYYYLGSYNGSGSGVLDGNISNVQLYSKVLSADEVLQNYNALKGRYT